MEFVYAIGFLCGGPLLFFGAGYFTCYYTQVKYQLRLDRRDGIEAVETDGRAAALKRRGATFGS